MSGVGSDETGVTAIADQRTNLVIHTHTHNTREVSHQKEVGSFFFAKKKVTEKKKKGSTRVKEVLYGGKLH